MRRTALLCLILSLASCQAPPPEAAPKQAAAPAGADARPLAYVAGEAITSRDLLGPLTEAAGGEVLVELTLDKLIRRRLADRGIELTPAMLESERQRVLDSLSDDPDEAAELLRRLRERRGLGEQRFTLLLRRNAGLRKLIGDVEVTSEAVRQAYALEYGPKYRARLITTGTLAEAAELRKRAVAGESFSELAAEHSTDASRARGGLLAPISPADPSYPAPVREALKELAETDAEISEVLALGGQYALLKLERKIDSRDVELADAREQLTARAQTRLERLRMERLARELLSEARVVVLDPALDQSWTSQKDDFLAP